MEAIKKNIKDDLKIVIVSLNEVKSLMHISQHMAALEKIDNILERVKELSNQVNEIPPTNIFH